LDLFHRLFDQIVLVMESFLLAEVVKAMFEWLDEQLILGVGMRRDELGHNRRQ